MDFYFPPIKLEQLRKELIKNYNQKNLYRGKDRIDKSFKELLFKLTSLAEDKVKSFSYKLTSEELLLFASYLPYNDYQLDLNNIINALEVRYKNRFLDVSYRAYQHSMGNKIFNNWFKNKLEENINYKVSRTVKSEKLFGIFSSSNIVQGYFNYGKETKLKYGELLDDFEIVKTSILSSEIDKYYLINATREMFIELGSMELLRRTDSFTIMEHGLLLNNYLSKLNIKEFHDNYLQKIVDYFEAPYRSNSEMWNYVDEANKRKFQNWIGIHHMQTILGNDERTNFWKSYLGTVKNTYMHEESGRLALDFGAFVVVEFQHKNNATYIYRSEVFYKNYIKYFEKSNSSKNKSLKDTAVAIKWLSHGGHWQYKFNDELRELGIRK
ncbi:MAG: EH signature domain-containing protein [Acidaminobacteraceae bacterium]